jgi:hypothetical protein
MTNDREDRLHGKLECTLGGVREYSEGYPVELRRNVKTGRLFIVAYNEGHNNIVQIDLLDLLEWCAANPHPAVSVISNNTAVGTVYPIR